MVNFSINEVLLVQFRSWVRLHLVKFSHGLAGTLGRSPPRRGGWKRRHLRGWTVNDRNAPARLVLSLRLGETEDFLPRRVDRERPQENTLQHCDIVCWEGGDQENRPCFKQSVFCGNQESHRDPGPGPWNVSFFDPCRSSVDNHQDPKSPRRQKLFSCQQVRRT